MKCDRKNKRMRYVGRYEGFDFYEYRPQLFRPYYMDYPKTDHPDYEERLVHKIRMMLEYIRGGYRVIYLMQENVVAGHAVVAPGGRRLAMSNKKDIVLGPIFVSPSMRGRGIGTTAIGVILNQLDLDYQYAYEFISRYNAASIRTVEKNKFEFVGYADPAGLMKKLHQSADGHYVVYRYGKK